MTSATSEGIESGGPTTLERIRDLVDTNPGHTVRELVAIGRRAGLDVDKRLMNSSLYKLRGLQCVQTAPASNGSAPRWMPHQVGSENGRHVERRRVRTATTQAISTERVTAFQRLVLRGGETVSVGVVTESANDPYVSFDVLDDRVVVAVNDAHPICSTLSHNVESFNLVVAMAIVDAVTQTRLSRFRGDNSIERMIEIRDAVWREFALLRDVPTIQTEALGGSDP
jgi:hypothetical protein